MKKNGLPKVSIVIIGLNEAENLKNTFQAIYNMDYPNEKLEIIYVDSGSKDQSLEIAKKFSSKIFIEDKNPTAARGRNRGLLEAKCDIIHFIDADYQINKEYLKKAVNVLNNENIHAVTAPLEENSKTLLNKILSSPRKLLKVGYANATNAGGTYKRNALLRVNGYDERICRGEETELGERFREAGYNIWLIDGKLGIHEPKFINIFGLFKREFINGKSTIHNMLIKGQNEYYRNLNRYVLKCFIINFLTLFIFIFSIILNIFHVFWIFILIRLTYLFIKFRFIWKIKDIEYFASIFLLFLFSPIYFLGQITVLLKYSIFKKKKVDFIQKKDNLSKFI